MVEPLPVGVCLTAVFDSCHSGTLLDLDHYDCNKVDYAEMTGKGSRKPRSEKASARELECFSHLELSAEP